MCECTPSVKDRYCGRPGCRSPQAVEQERINRQAEEWARKRGEAMGDERSVDEPDRLGDVAV